MEAICRKPVHQETAPPPARPQWSERLRREVVGLIREDADAFLAHYSKPVGYWKF